MSPMEQCVRDLLVAGKDDYVYLAEVLRVVESVDDTPSGDVMQRTLDVIQEVAQKGLMELGDLKDDGFHKWALPIQDCIDRIERQWKALGRAPSLGEICWLRNTVGGDVLGEQLQA